MKYTLESDPGLADVGFSMGMGMAPELDRVRKMFQMTNLTNKNNFSFMYYAEKSVPGLADVGFSMGMGMAPEVHPDLWGHH